MTLLVLGGTSDAKQLTRQLQQRSIPLIYSIAGLVRQPDLDCDVVSGGFSQFGGLASYIQSAGISALLDATHPYASRMSTTAVDVAAECRLPVWRYLRPEWQASADDDWRSFAIWDEVVNALIEFESVLFSAGQLTQSFVDQLITALGIHDQQQWLRSAVEPSLQMPASMRWIEAIGPFSLEAEDEIITRLAIDALVSKNSGGDATAAKLQIARERSIPVFMLERPQLPAADAEFSTIDACSAFINLKMNQRQLHYAD